jgi:hypothetical protein
MAAIAIPAIEAVVVRVLAALGVGVVAGAAGEAAKEQARKRQEEADRTKSAPIARTDATTKERKKCKDCPPDKGVTALQSTAGWSDDSITYQMRIAQMPPAPPGSLTEWSFNGVQFDGFDSSQCLLKEAKARYDQFFDEWGGFKYSFQEKIFIKMLNEAVSQNNAAVPKPPTQLQWNFMEPTSYRYMSKVLLRATPEIEVLYRP